MNKLKQVFGKKEESSSNAATGEEVQHESRSSSITRQILNPNHDKYDENVHGTTSTATPNVSNSESLVAPGSDVKLQADPNKESSGQGGIMRQIMNPGGNRYDEERHGITAVPVGETAPTGRAGDLETDHQRQSQGQGGIARQILNPGGEKYDEQSHGTTARTIPDTDEQHHHTTTGATGAVPSSSGYTEQGHHTAAAGVVPTSSSTYDEQHQTAATVPSSSGYSSGLVTKTGAQPSDETPGPPGHHSDITHGKTTVPDPTTDNTATEYWDRT